MSSRPNCHMVFHLSDPPYTIDAVRAFFQRNGGCDHREPAHIRFPNRVTPDEH
jgi:hypothetical protein